MPAIWKKLCSVLYTSCHCCFSRATSGRLCLVCFSYCLFVSIFSSVAGPIFWNEVFFHWVYCSLWPITNSCLRPALFSTCSPFENFQTISFDPFKPLLGRSLWVWKSQTVFWKSLCLFSSSYGRCSCFCHYKVSETPRILCIFYLWYLSPHTHTSIRWL